MLQQVGHKIIAWDLFLIIVFRLKNPSIFSGVCIRMIISGTFIGLDDTIIKAIWIQLQRCNCIK